MEFKRGSIYLLTFKRIFETEYPNGKPKFVLILQEGDYFKNYDTVEVLLITGDKSHKNRRRYETDVAIEPGTTKLRRKSWIICAQPYPIMKSMFDEDDVQYIDTLSPEMMKDVEAALLNGLCIELQDEIEKEDTFAESFSKFLLGTFVGAIGTAAYLKYRDKNSENNTIIESELDESEKVSISDKDAIHNNV